MGQVQGGGISIAGGSPTFEGCSIRHNHARGQRDGDAGGGGIAILNGNGAIEFKNCTVGDNEADEGGGLLIRGGQNVHFLGTTFTHNRIRAAGSGGALFIDTSGFNEFTDCEFHANHATNDGMGE